MPSGGRQQRRCQTTVNLTNHETEKGVGGLRTVTNAFKHTCTNEPGGGGRVSLAVSVAGGHEAGLIKRTQQCNGDKYFRESSYNDSDEEVIASNVLPDIVNHLLANSPAAAASEPQPAASSSLLRSSSSSAQHNKPYLRADSGSKHNQQHNLEVSSYFLIQHNK